MQFNRQLERGQIQRLQLQQELAAQQVQTQQRLAQLGEAAHRDQALQTQVKDMLTDACSHLAVHVGLSLETAEGIAGKLQTAPFVLQAEFVLHLTMQGNRGL